MKSFGDILKDIRIDKDMSQEEFAKLLNTSKQVISRYENGQRTPKITVVQEFADILGVPIGDLTPAPALPANIRPVEKVKVPLIGSIAAGLPIFAEEDLDTYIEADSDIRCDFALIVEGDSMEPTIHNGDVVFIRKQDDVDDGQIAAVIIDDSATLKRVYHIPGGVQLISENPKYPPQIYTCDNSDYVAVLGRAVAYKRML